jgi:poly-beta-1,6-N-acetyl-D-glucosamine synthase
MKVYESKYIIISPVRNEEKHIEKVIRSVFSQSIRPMRWIIVDDGSSDNTSMIIEKYAQKVNWISLIKLADRGYYDLMTGGEIKAFYKGYNFIQDIEYDFLGKLDGDISFNEDYFENLLKEFAINSKLGIASGACYYLTNNRLVMEKSYFKHVRGAARLYRKECWKDIGGVIDDLAWDAVDVYKARMLGWDTYSFENIKMIHHVKTGTKGGLIHGIIRRGRVEYLMGTHPIFFCFKAIKNVFNKPYMLMSLLYILGYLKCFVKKENRVVDPDLMAYIREDQRNRIFSKIEDTIGKRNRRIMS